MAATITTTIAIYFLIWWLVLFTVLPWGVTAQGENSVPGTDPGAPTVHRLGARLIWTTVISAMIYAVGAAVFLSGLLTLDDLASLYGR